MQGLHCIRFIVVGESLRFRPDIFASPSQSQHRVHLFLGCAAGCAAAGISQAVAVFDGETIEASALIVGIAAAVFADGRAGPLPPPSTNAEVGLRRPFLRAGAAAARHITCHKGNSFITCIKSIH